jgi:hypothetical protein
MRSAQVVSIIGLIGLLSVASATDTRPNPLAQAKAGQWTIHRTASPSSLTDETFTYEWVVKVDGRKVVIRTQPLDRDLERGLASPVESTLDVDAPTPPIVESPAGEEELLIHGTRLLCRKVETVEIMSEGMTKTISWLSDRIPISGLVKRVKLDRDGKEIFRTDLIDWGTTGGAERPLAPAREGKAPLHKD